MHEANLPSATYVKLCEHGSTLWSDPNMQLFLNLIVIFTFSWHYGSKKEVQAKTQNKAFMGIQMSQS